nr:hypothetical protein [Tanacetum cinerariifolium]
MVRLETEQEILQSKRRYLTIDHLNMETEGAQVMDNNNNKAIRASRFVLAYQRVQEHQYITKLAEEERKNVQIIDL